MSAWYVHRIAPTLNLPSWWREADQRAMIQVYSALVTMDLRESPTAVPNRNTVTTTRSHGWENNTGCNLTLDLKNTETHL